MYRRRGCHLCEAFLAVLLALSQGQGHELEIRDVDQRPEWESEWGEAVPVLLIRGREICRYHMDPSRYNAAL